MAKAKYVSMQEAADLLGVNRSTVWRWVREGRLTARVDPLNRRRRRIPRREVDALLASARE